MSGNLYAIADKYRDLLDEIEELDGEITPEIDEQLTIVQEDLEDKLYAYYSIIQSSKGQDEIIKDQQSRLSAMLTRNENLRKKLSSKVVDACNEFGYTGKSGNKKIDLDTLSVYTANRSAVEIEDEDAFNDPRFCTVTVKLPNDLKLVREVLLLATKMAEDKEMVAELNETLKKDISKTRVMNALKLGKKVKGAKIVTRTHSVMR